MPALARGRKVEASFATGKAGDPRIW